MLALPNNSDVRITSACAEKSVLLAVPTLSIGNYLRMRGEENPLRPANSQIAELPPHARRRDLISTGFGAPLGITSACAEKRFLVPFVFKESWNYLRMRGEEASILCT